MLERHGSETAARDGTAARRQGEPSRVSAGPVSLDEVVRAARELVAAYGPAAGRLMRARMRAVRRRGDAESAALWHAIAQAVDHELGGRGTAD